MACSASSRRSRRSARPCSAAARAMSSTSPSMASCASGRSATSAERERRRGTGGCANDDQAADEKRSLAKAASTDAPRERGLDDRVGADRKQDRDRRRRELRTGGAGRRERDRIDVGKASDERGEIEALIAKVRLGRLRHEQDHGEQDAEPDRAAEVEWILDLDDLTVRRLHIGGLAKHEQPTRDRADGSASE